MASEEEALNIEDAYLTDEEVLLCKPQGKWLPSSTGANPNGGEWIYLTDEVRLVSSEATEKALKWVASQCESWDCNISDYFRLLDAAKSKV